MKFEHTNSIEDIKKLKESSNVEFKRSEDKLPESFWETYSAFANTEGGLIILGVLEKKDWMEFKGVSNPDKIRKDIFNTLENQNKVSRNLLDDSKVKVASLSLEKWKS